MGQLSIADHLTTMSMDLVDQSICSRRDRDSLLTMLEVQAKVLADCQRIGVHLTAHLDLTACEAELNTRDIGQCDRSKLSSRPLFSGLQFRGFSQD